MLALNGKQGRFYSDQAPEKLNKLNCIEIFLLFFPVIFALDTMNVISLKVNLTYIVTLTKVNVKTAKVIILLFCLNFLGHQVGQRQTRQC